MVQRIMACVGVWGLSWYYILARYNQMRPSKLGGVGEGIEGVERQGEEGRREERRDTRKLLEGLER